MMESLELWRRLLTTESVSTRGHTAAAPTGLRVAGVSLGPSPGQWNMCGNEPGSFQALSFSFHCWMSRWQGFGDSESTRKDHGSLLHGDEAPVKTKLLFGLGPSCIWGRVCYTK